MTNLGSQQNWPSWPYEGSKDCSQGFCSIYCPQWCYIIFPPPPPFELADDSPSGPSFSPLVIAIIGVIASAFLLVTYYTIISRYCGRLDFLHRRLHRHAPPAQPHAELDAPSGQHEGWHFSASNGLDEALISKISVYRYKRDEGVIDGTDCSVCLSEFQEDESLRLLPKCSHAFHVHCIDTWLRSHSNCPLCRANIVSASPGPPPLPLLPPPPEPQLVNPPASSNGETNDEVVVIIEEDCNRTAEEEEEEEEGEYSSPLENERDAPKDSSLEEEHLAVEIGDHECQAVRRSFSMDSSNLVRMSIADVLRSSMDDEFLVATKDHSFTTGAGSSRYGKGSSRSRGLHCGMSPVPMKRSFSSGRFCLTRQARGRNSVLPL